MSTIPIALDCRGANRLREMVPIGRRDMIYVDLAMDMCLWIG